MRADEFLDRLHRLIAEGTHVVIITDHAEMRMEERDVLRRQIWNCLEWGNAHSAPEFCPKHGNWKMKVIDHPLGTVPLIVVAAIETPPAGENIVVVTVFYLEK